jgi:hypothetical protein
MTNSVRHVTDQRTLLGSNLTALKAEASIDTVWPVRVRTGENSNRPSGDNGDTKFRAALNQHIAHTSQRMWPINISMRIAPWKVSRAGNGDLLFQQFIVGLQIIVGDWPINPDAIL